MRPSAVVGDQGARFLVSDKKASLGAGLPVFAQWNQSMVNSPVSMMVISVGRKRTS